MICSANQLTGFYMMATLAFNKLIQDKSLSNLRLRTSFIYGPLIKIWTVLEAEKEAVSNKNLINLDKENPVIPTSYQLDPTVLLQGQAVCKCSYIRFCIVMLFVIDKNKVEKLLKKCSTESQRGFQENLKGYYYTIRKSIN